MSLKYVKLNGESVLVQYQTDCENRFNIEIQKVFYKELDIAPCLDEVTLDDLAIDIMKEEW